MKRSRVVLTFEFVDGMLQCHHSNETSSVAYLHGTICFFNILRNEIWDFSCIFILDALGS